jgi:hypothetical protein
MSTYGTAARWFTVQPMLGKLDALRILLDAGAAVERAGPHGFTALCLAISYQRAEAVELLLERGAVVDSPLMIRNAGGQLVWTTPLHVAARANNATAAIVQLLLDAGARPRQLGDAAPPWTEMTPLDVALARMNWEVAAALVGPVLAAVEGTAGKARLIAAVRAAALLNGGEVAGLLLSSLPPDLRDLPNADVSDGADVFAAIPAALTCVCVLAGAVSFVLTSRQRRKAKEKLMEAYRAIVVSLPQHSGPRSSPTRRLHTHCVRMSFQQSLSRLLLQLNSVLRSVCVSGSCLPRSPRLVMAASLHSLRTSPAGSLHACCQ